MKITRENFRMSLNMKCSRTTHFARTAVACRDSGSTTPFITHSKDTFTLAADTATRAENWKKINIFLLLLILYAFDHFTPMSAFKKYIQKNYQKNILPIRHIL